MTQTKKASTRIALPFSMSTIENTSGQGYSVRVRHLTRTGNEIACRVYPFDERIDAAGYIADLHALFVRIGYIQLESQIAARFIYRVRDDHADALMIKDRAAFRILVEIYDNSAIPSDLPDGGEDAENGNKTPIFTRTARAEIEENCAAFLRAAEGE